MDETSAVLGLPHIVVFARFPLPCWAVGGVNAVTARVTLSTELQCDSHLGGGGVWGAGVYSLSCKQPLAGHTGQYSLPHPTPQGLTLLPHPSPQVVTLTLLSCPSVAIPYLHAGIPAGSGWREDPSSLGWVCPHFPRQHANEVRRCMSQCRNSLCASN